MSLPRWLLPYSITVFESAKLYLFGFLGRKQKHLPQIFVIGQNKTGTTTVHKALRRTGSRHLTINAITAGYYQKKNDDPLRKIARRFDTFDDWPWNRARIVEKTMRWFPDARFVLLERDEQKWISSFKRFMIVSKREDQLPENVGQTDEEYIEKHLRKHNQRMKALFADCPERLLVVDLEAPNAEEYLQKFTQRENLSLGWENKTPEISKT